MTFRSFFGLIILLAALLVLGTSCSRKYGCPAYQTTKTEVNKNGTPKKGSSSQLFSKKMRRNR